MTELVAVLDKNKRLVGTKHKVRPGKDDVLLPNGCDLPFDGSYKWTGDCFTPLGHGFGPVVAKSPISESAVLYQLTVALGDDAPPPARGWAAWYAENLKVREEEQAMRAGKPKTRR